MFSSPLEPSADMRMAANAIYDMYVAFTAKGFTENQAFRLIAEMLVAQQRGLND